MKLVLRSHENKHDVLKYPSIKKGFSIVHWILFKLKRQFPVRVAQLFKIFPSSYGTQRCSKNLAAESNQQPPAVSNNNTSSSLEVPFNISLVPVLSPTRSLLCRFPEQTFVLILCFFSRAIQLSSLFLQTLVTSSHIILRNPLTCTIA